jgi:hypothetical protein
MKAKFNDQSPAKKQKVNAAGQSEIKKWSDQRPTEKQEVDGEGQSESMGFSRLSLLLNAEQLIIERYPIPGSSGECLDYF